ncbi:MAG: DEAD/DEAH box helicase [Christensenellaceae bacterium]|jgi:transcription-repair coupling factor (superfamily II helicase)|nr:DEAD/DEAH box helicase [Christensenellaceae bacterium]
MNPIFKPFFDKDTIKISVGQAIERHELIKKLTDFGYEYTVKGDVVDVEHYGILRIMFAGETIEAIKKIDKFYMRTRETLQTFEIIKKTQDSANQVSKEIAAFVKKTDFILPPVGDCVVHSLHGIGRYAGIEKKQIGGKENQYYIIQYDGNALVFVPLGQHEHLSNYVGEPTRLHKIGGQDFAAAKQRVRRRLKELSFKLSEVYKLRANSRPKIYQINPEINLAFAKTFPYELTADQKKVLAEIYDDLQSNKIMDRLLCGDVGFGKTEVALRTAFNAIINDFQVLLLCPTTILSVQHYNLAKERFSKFGMKVQICNRFNNQYPDNDADLVIGTHKLLSLPENYFKRLGLLIIDEEQRFGVETKEKIKKTVKNADVLTMSATPIPRTLNLALIGMRDISVITTPPKDKLPVITIVEEFSWQLLINAIEKENGQSIILYNNVQTITSFTNQLKKQILNKRIDFLHGQLSSTEIQLKIEKIYECNTDVIVASSIIENGIDLNTANTLFVINAERLGVAAMHQLRGRVGRKTAQAYAYFTYPKLEDLSEISRERINAIKNFYTQGAGFNIAMRDLELRGGGEVLGANQSGHIDEIGMEAFTQILSEIAEENKLSNK